ncbi:hypothetical protein HMPREF9062_0787 [Actinomyces sp. oral taxon 448 str. F0400]|nr:hypothetical protein HMPREF9062_0787 [Actinomyces sp. oral taxon 448 str. F0400]
MRGPGAARAAPRRPLLRASRSMRDTARTVYHVGQTMLDTVRLS